MRKRVVMLSGSQAAHRAVEAALRKMVGDGRVLLRIFSDPDELVGGIKNRSVDFDLFLADQPMSGMDTLAVVSMLKKERAFLTKPIVMLTAEDSAEIILKGKEAGLSGWVIKPFSSESLHRFIERVLFQKCDHPGLRWRRCHAADGRTVIASWS